MELNCKGCFYNRLMRAWGDEFEACYYKVENDKELYTVNGDDCSGFEIKEKQLEFEITEVAG